MFLPYAKHEQEKEEIIQMILESAENEEENLSISLDDYFSDSDIEYILREVEKRYGVF